MKNAIEILDFVLPSHNPKARKRAKKEAVAEAKRFISALSKKWPLRPYMWAYSAEGAYYEFFNGKKPKSHPPGLSGGKWTKVVVLPYKGKK